MNVKALAILIVLIGAFDLGFAGTAWSEEPQQATAPAKVDIPQVFTDHCARCHNIDGTKAVCPDLSTIGTRRDAAYIRQSILDPNAYVVPGYPMNVMPLNFAQILTPEQVNTLVTFLLTLHGQTVNPNTVGRKVQW